MVEKVLVTGAGGYVGLHVVELLLKNAFHVKATARNQAKADAIKNLFPEYKDQLSVAIADISKENAFAGLLDGLSGVFHVASPFLLSNVKSNLDELLNPAINGVVSLLQEAAKVPTIKRVVLTASFVCMIDPSKPKGHLYTENDYNPFTLEQAANADTVTAYVASKRLAEKAAFDFVEKNKPHFDVVSLCPPMIYGPLAKITGDYSESAKKFFELLEGKFEPEAYPFDLFVDVRDLAQAHLLAFQKPEASNKRFLVSNGNYFWQEVADFAHKNFPNQTQTKVGHPGQYPELNSRSDNTQARTVLGVQFRPKEETYRDIITQYLDLKAKGTKFD